MSQAPLARPTRRNPSAFTHTPSKLSHSTSRQDLKDRHEHHQDQDGDPTPSPTPSAQFNQIFTHTHLTPSKPESSVRHRNRGTNTTSPGPHTPSTPKIHYSPYATSTPPGALSKSTSIPFDMVASAKAARRAEEEIKLRGREATPGTKRKRFVRRKPLWQRIKALPEHVYDQALFHYPIHIESILPSTHLANPTSLALHAIHWFLLAPLLKSSTEPESVLRRSTPQTGVGSRWDRWEDEGKVKGRGFGGGLTTLIFTLLLLILASANSIYLFTRFRAYDMQLRSAREPISSPNASPVSAPKAQHVDEDVFGGVTDDQPPTNPKMRRVANTLIGLTKWLHSAVLSIFGYQSANGLGASSSSDDKIQSLRVWEPPEFCLAFFCAYPPSAPLLSYLLTPIHPFITPVLHLITSFLLSHLAASYVQFVKDRMILSAEVMREYDRRFVYKRVFASRVDRGVQTEQAESLW